MNLFVCKFLRFLHTYIIRFLETSTAPTIGSPETARRELDWNAIMSSLPAPD